MEDCTEERDRSVTSRQAKGRDRSWRVRDLEEEDEAEEEELPNSLRIWRMTESGFSLFLKGSCVPSSEFSSARRRFFLSAITTRNIDSALLVTGDY